jgi:O-antigen/teichoic acid export membrane protein
LVEKFKRLLKDSFIYGLERYLAAFAGVFLVPVYTRIFTPDDYGVIEVINTIISIVAVFAVLGMDSALAFHFYDTKEEKDRKIIISTNFLFRIAFICLLSMILIIAADFISEKFLKSLEKAIYLKIAIVTLLFGSILGFCLDLLRFRLKPVRFSIVSLGSTTCVIALSIYLVVYLKAGLYGVFGANVITGLIFAVVAVWMNRGQIKILFSAIRLKRMLAYGLPLVPASVSIWVVGFSDRFFLTTYSTLQEVGLYSIGYKLSMVLSLITAAFQMAWGPLAFSIKDEPDARVFYSRVLTYYLVVTTVAALILSVFAKEILMVFTTSAFVGGYRVVGLLVYSIIFSGAYYIFAIGVNLTGKTAYISWTTGVAAISNIILNFILVPRYGMMGAAISSVIAQGISAYLLYLISQKFYPIEYEISKIVKIVILSAILIFLGVNAETIFVKAAILFLYPILLLTVRIIGRQEIYALRDIILRIKPFTG